MYFSVNLIKQYDARLKEKDELIGLLRGEVEVLQNEIYLYFRLNEFTIKKH
jgi:hypothetical protein